MAEASIAIEVVYATAERQWLLTCEVPAGSSVSDALRLSGLVEQVPGLDLARCPVGIFGKVVSDPAVRRIKAGDRLEVYRPLQVDPLEARKRRAAKARAAREG
jgi:uncharacterized protein